MMEHSQQRQFKCEDLGKKGGKPNVLEHFQIPCASLTKHHPGSSILTIEGTVRELATASSTKKPCFERQ